MSRINREVLVGEAESLRQGFASAVLEARKNKDEIAEASFQAYREQANRMVIYLGGIGLGDDLIKS